MLRLIWILEPAVDCFHFFSVRPFIQWKALFTFASLHTLVSGLSPNMWNVTVGPASFVFICFWYMKTSWMLHLRKLALWHLKHYTWGLQLWRTAVPALPHSRWVDVGGWWPADPTAVLRLTAFLFKIHLCGLCAVWQWGGHSSAISSTKYLFCFFLKPNFKWKQSLHVLHRSPSTNSCLPDRRFLLSLHRFTRYSCMMLSFSTLTKC